jgi:hypothetical protein
MKHNACPACGDTEWLEQWIGEDGQLMRRCSVTGCHASYEVSELELELSDMTDALRIVIDERDELQRRLTDMEGQALEAALSAVTKERASAELLDTLREIAELPDDGLVRAFRAGVAAFAKRES